MRGKNYTANSRPSAASHGSLTAERLEGMTTAATFYGGSAGVYPQRTEGPEPSLAKNHDGHILEVTMY
jgi:hypothetical protein